MTSVSNEQKCACAECGEIESYARSLTHGPSEQDLNARRNHRLTEIIAKWQRVGSPFGCAAAIMAEFQVTHRDEIGG